MNLLVIGSGGREHALAWKLAQPENVTSVYVAPGNAGTALEPKLTNVDINPMDFDALVDFAQSNNIAMTMVGPEQPLVNGIVDRFNAYGLACFGPSKAAAQLEGSKRFSKDFLKRHQIPTAAYECFSDVDAAITYLQSCSMPIVIKADGLAAGKGVIIAENLQQATDTVKDMLSGNAFGDAGHQVVIESFLTGEEASFIVMVDGKNVLPMASSQDHKRVGNDDTGLNTGGMGAYSPAPVVSDEVHQRILDQVIYPTVSAMAAEGMPYKGFLYAGLMIADDGQPNVIEFNCRFGDPETQPIIMRLQTNLVSLCQATIEGTLDQQQISWDLRHAIGVVMAAGGYPENYAKNKIISGLDAAEGKGDDSKIFHAGTRLSEGNIVTNGGRVLCVTALGDNIKLAQQKAYQQLKIIDWEDCYYRDDIGYRAVERLDS